MWLVSSRSGSPVVPVLPHNWSAFYPVCHLSCATGRTLNFPCHFFELETFLVSLRTWMNNTRENQCPADSLCCPSKALGPKIKVLRGWRTQFPFSVLHSALQSITFSVPKIQLLLKARSTNIFGNNKLGLGLLPSLVQRVCSISESVTKLMSSFWASVSSRYLGSDSSKQHNK